MENTTYVFTMSFQAQFKWVLFYNKSSVVFHPAIEVKLSLHSLLMSCSQSNPKSTDLLPCIQLAKLKQHAIQAAVTCQLLLFPLLNSWQPNSTPAPLFYTVWLYQWYFCCHWCLLCPVPRRSICCLVHSQKPFHKGPWQGGELIAESYHQCTYCKRKSFWFFKVFFDNSVSNRTEFLDWIWPGKNKQTTDLVLLKLHRVRPYLSSEHVYTKIVALVLAGITKM